MISNIEIIAHLEKLQLTVDELTDEVSNKYDALPLMKEVEDIIFKSQLPLEDKLQLSLLTIRIIKLLSPRTKT